MYVSLRHCSIHIIKRLPNISRITLLELFELFLELFCSRNDEKHILSKISEHQGGAGRVRRLFIANERETEGKEWVEDRRVRTIAVQKAVEVQSVSGGSQVGWGGRGPGEVGSQRSEI